MFESDSGTVGRTEAGRPDTDRARFARRPRYCHSAGGDHASCFDLASYREGEWMK